MAIKTSGWRGCSDVGMTHYNEWADPDLNIKYNGDIYVFNYWDIEEALWDMFLETEGVSESDTYDTRGNISEDWDKKFDEFCQDEAYNYMVDCIINGYFEEGSYSWHDSYK